MFSFKALLIMLKERGGKILFPEYSHTIASGSSNAYTATQDCFYFCLVNGSNDSASISVNGTNLGSYAYARFLLAYT